MLSVSAPSGVVSAQENKVRLAPLVGSSAVLGGHSQETSTQMVVEVEARLHQCSPQVIEHSPVMTLSCPYCGGSGGGFGMIWWAEHRQYVCGACREYAALTYDGQTNVASTEMASPRQVRVEPWAHRDSVGTLPAAVDNA